MSSAKGYRSKYSGHQSSSDGVSGPQIPSESIRRMGESIGINNLSDATSRFLGQEVTLRLKRVLQEALKFHAKSKRRKLSTHGIDYSLRTLNVEPLYGFDVSSAEAGLPFRFASGGGRELCFLETAIEIDLKLAAASPDLSKISPDVDLQVHWLSIDGIQPAIPENPPLVSRQQQRLESVDPLMATSAAASDKSLKLKPKKQRMEAVRLQQYATRELSIELQLYYKVITEACIGSSDEKRAQALQSLSRESGLHQMIPRLCTFISEGVKVNVVQNNLAILIYLMRMVKAILDNDSLILEKYLHELIPSVVTCVVSKQLCEKPEAERHWALRNFGARLLGQICKAYNTSTNGVQVRLTRLLTKALDRGVPLPSAYGALSALCELGVDVQRTLVLTRLKSIGDRIDSEGVGSLGTERFAAVEHITALVVRVLTLTITRRTLTPKSIEEYKEEFGPFFGSILYASVCTYSAPVIPVTSAVSSVPMFYEFEDQLITFQSPTFNQIEVMDD